MIQRSHIAQIMQNYFDETDRRSRANPVALEAQLLNLAAVPLENLNLRISRETSQSLQTVPTRIDNGGVYYSSSVPRQLLTGPDQTSFSSVVGAIGSNLTTLSVYNDTLPTPTRITTGISVPLANPILFNVIGTGDELSQTFTVQYVNPGPLPIPNILTLWIDQIGLNEIFVTLTIIGDVAPQPAWVRERVKTTEVLQIPSQGIAFTRNRWSNIDQIAIRGLPIGVRLRGWSMPFNIPATVDLARPYTSPWDRDVLYPRHWQIFNPEGFLYEMYMAAQLTGLVAINSYTLSNTMTDVAVEPFTNGMFISSATNLYYMDRREYQADLTKSGLSAEPLFGLHIEIDIGKTGKTHYVLLSGIAFANSINISQYRYTVNGINCILPDGSLGPIDSGWRPGTPQAVSFPLVSPGDYQFRLECQDINGQLTFDIRPYRNAALVPLTVIDMSKAVDNIQGMAFDSYGQLWLWNGSFAIPLTIHYDAYILDADTGTIFVTEPFDSLQIS